MDPTAETKTPGKVALEELKAQNPRAVLLAAGGDEIIVTPPTRTIWRRFKACLADERKRLDATEVLVRDCLLWPEKAKFEEMLERRPALAETFGDSVAELAGAALEVEKNG